MPHSYPDFNVKLFFFVFYYIHKVQIYNPGLFHNY